jgi:hypothetical protein
MRIRMFQVVLAMTFLCAVCATQSNDAPHVTGLGPEIRAKLQQTIPPKAGNGNPIIQEIRDDGSGKENKNSPVLGSKTGTGCVSTDASHPCPQQPPPQKTGKDNPPN